MRRKILVVVLGAALCGRTVRAQFGGVVYDPTNYQNALLRYYQLEQHLVQLQQTYQKVLAHYNLALEMARNIQNMPERYRVRFTAWRNGTSLDRFGNTGGWISGINSGSVGAGYQQSTIELLPYTRGQLAGMEPDELDRVRSQYASVELSDGANLTAMATIGSIRQSSAALESKMANLEDDSFSAEAGLNSEISVLNKINAANVLTLRSVQDSNKLLASLLEQQIIFAKQQRELTANSINADITRRAAMPINLARVTGTLTSSLENFRMP